MKLLRKILLPIVPIYYAITWLRNKLYDHDYKKSIGYNFPLICVGNLSAGGTGKTPMIEYLIRLLLQDYKIATLSRGYGRKTKGFIIADESADATTIGDEPLQFYRKFDNVVVSVDGDRQNGISKLKSNVQPEIILLDDAFQHRKVSAGYTILLTSYGNLYANDLVLPTGNLREPKSGAKRADVIVVTKCPINISHEKKKSIIKELNPLASQKVYFSWIFYSADVHNENETKPLQSLKKQEVSIVTGIADPSPFLDFLQSQLNNFEHLKFADHHKFSEEEIKQLKKKSIILTTEKDYVRLRPYFKDDMSKLYYLPIEFEIDKAQEFNRGITNYVDSY